MSQSNDRIPPMLELIKKKMLDPREISRHDRLMCLQYLRIETNLTQARMANMLGVSLRQCQMDIAYLNRTMAMRFPKDDLEAVFDYFFTEYWVQKERARAAREYELEQKLFFGFIDRLEKFGILKPAPTGDVVFGDKIVQNNQMNAFKIAESLNDEQKKKLRDALISAGFGKGGQKTIEQSDRPA